MRSVLTYINGVPTDMLFSDQFDLLKLMFNILNILMKKKIISYFEAREILKDSLSPRMADKEKEEYLNKIIKKDEPSKK